MTDLAAWLLSAMAWDINVTIERIQGHNGLFGDSRYPAAICYIMALLHTAIALCHP